MTPQDIIENIRKIAAENPDFVYHEPNSGICSYFPDMHNPQGCIVGAAIRACGGKITEDHEHDSAALVVQELCGLPPRDEPDDPQIMWIQDVQDFQDRKSPWGCAIIRADHRTKEIE